MPAFTLLQWILPVLAGLWSGKRFVDPAFQDPVLGLAAPSAVWLLTR